MPKIETFTAPVSQIQARSTADMFYDGSGAKKIIDTLDSASKDFIKLEEDESRIQAARVLAESRQKWMLDMDQMRRTAEETGQYEGFTENFRKSYLEWSKSVPDQIKNNGVRRDFETNLIEMGSTFLGGALDYESRKRGELIKKNYEATIEPFLSDIAMAETPVALENALSGFDYVVDQLPDGELRQDAKSKIKGAAYRQSIALSNMSEPIHLTIDDLRNDPDILPQDKLNLVTFGMGAVQTANKTNAAETSRYLETLQEEAKIGGLDVGWQVPTINSVLALPVGSPERVALEKQVSFIHDLNTQSRIAMSGTFDEINSQRKKLDDELNSNSSELEGKTITQQKIVLFNQSLANRDEMLNKNFAQSAIKFSDNVAAKYEIFSKSSQENQAKLFASYADSVDVFASNIGFSGRKKYIPDEQVDVLVNEISSSLDKRDGVMQITNKLEAMKTTYGSRWKDVVRQIGGVDEDMAVVSVIPNISPETHGLAKSNKLRQDLITSVVNRKIDKEAYKSIDEGTANSIKTYSDLAEYEAVFENSGLREEFAPRRAAYESLAKLYVVRGKSVGDASDEAFKTIFGDKSVYKDSIIYPSNIKNFNRVYAGSFEALKGMSFNPPRDTTKIEMDRVKSNPIDYIDFVASPNQNGLMAIWRGGLGEPVLSNSGPIIIPFSQGELNFKPSESYATPFGSPK